MSHPTRKRMSYALLVSILPSYTRPYPITSCLTLRKVSRIFILTTLSTGVSRGCVILLHFFQRHIDIHPSQTFLLTSPAAHGSQILALPQSCTFRMIMVETHDGLHLKFCVTGGPIPRQRMYFH